MRARPFFYPYVWQGLAGCQSLAISMLGAGAGTALRYSIDGVTSRTFTAPATAVKQASLEALERMGIAFESFDKFEYGELIYARAENRSIEIEIEPISPRATRMRIAAKNGGVLLRQRHRAARSWRRPSARSPGHRDRRAGGAVQCHSF